MDKSQTVTLWDAILLLAPMVGAGGLTAIVVAWFGRKSNGKPTKTEERPIESPWLVQNLLEIKLRGEEMDDKIAALVRAFSELTIQINTFNALLKRKDRHSDN